MRAAPTGLDPAQPHPAAVDPRAANIAYHDWQAAEYDDKWGISFDDRCRSYAVDRYRRVAPIAEWPCGRVLEIGAGTGFLLLNLMRAGLTEQGVVTDISPGMVAQATGSAARLGLSVTGQVADVTALGLRSASVELVIGHAVLHHVPDVEAALREIVRVLRPGGRFVIIGEPNDPGERIVRRLCRLTWSVARAVTCLPLLRGRWARPQTEVAPAAALEAVVDLHTFRPQSLAEYARRAGAVDVRTATVEATAAWFGWPVRTLEAAVHPDRLSWRWAQFAYRGWLALDTLDRWLAPVLPASLHYAVALTGRAPAGTAGPAGPP